MTCLVSLYHYVVTIVDTIHIFHKDKICLGFSRVKSTQNLLRKDINSNLNHNMCGGHLQKRHGYYLQVQLQMFVYNVIVCEFTVLVGDGLISGLGMLYQSC